MSAINLEYTVEDPKSYMLRSGDLAHLSQKAYQGFVLQNFGEQLFLTLKLQSPGIVHVIEMAPINIKTITFQLIDKKGEGQEETTSIFNRQEPTIIEFKASKFAKYLTRSVKVTAYMDSRENGGMGIRYLIVKGLKQEPVGRPGMHKANNISRKPLDLHRPSDSPHAPPVRVRGGNQKLFEQRKRSKEGSKDSRSELTEEQQLLKAIELSKREAEQRGHHFEESSEWHPKKEEKEEKQVKRPRGRPREKERERQNEAQRRDADNWQKFAQSKPDYQLVQLDKVRPFLKDVNAEWLQAQREAEEQLQIQQKYRLSKHIQVRHFNNRTVCVDLPNPKKSQVQKAAAQMGAKIVQEVTDHVLLIGARPDSEKVAKARKCRNVKVVTPNFIEECKQCQTYLSERDYFLKL